MHDRTEPQDSVTWGLERLQMPACWQHGFTGAGVRIGHLDTGVAATHPALRDRLASFAQFDAWGDMMPPTDPWDSGDHGTHTAGILCGGTIAGQAIGVAPQAQLCSGLVIEGGHPLVRVLAGLDWLLNQSVRVLCLSLGVPGYNPLFEISLARLRQQGVLTVCPIGNHGRRSSCSPANYPGVLAVGAIDPHDRLARFSGGHVCDGALSKPDLVAPGVEILSATPEGDLATQNGTSMAAAHVAGVAALLFQAQPKATVAEVEQALLTSCIPLPHLPPHRIGHGLVNPIAALEQLLTGEGRDRASRSPLIQPYAPASAIDPRLQRQLEEANPTDAVAGVAIVAGERDPLTLPDDAGLGEQVVQRVMQRLEKTAAETLSPTALRLMPRANAVAFIAPPAFLRALLLEPEVRFVSSTTIDLFYLG